MATPKTSTTSIKSAAASAAAATKAAAATTAARTSKPAKTPKPNPAADPATGGAEPVVSGPMMRKKELIDAVVEASGVKKKDAKPVVEAMLEVLGTALSESRELNLHPLGSVKIRRANDMTKARVLTAKIRQRKPEVVAAEAAAKAEAADDAE